MSAASCQRRGSAGFTLVELMVALMGGLFISLSVFALARDSGRFYQGETRIANATVSGLLGFERLRTDIARAGFMSSANVSRDVKTCGLPNATWPLNLRNLQALQVQQPNVIYPLLAANGRTPPALLLAGSYGSADQFAAHLTTTVAATTTFSLVASQPSLLRLGNGTNPTDATVQGVFQVNRALRIMQNGRTFYGQIVRATGGVTPTVTINSQPQILARDDPGNLEHCGVEIGMQDSLIFLNVVNFIHYDLRNLKTDPQTAQAQNTYASLYSSSAPAPGEDQRTELVRVEQDLLGQPIIGTEEIVAEYAVDLSVQVTAVTAGTPCAVGASCDPTVTVVAPGNALFPTFTGPAFGTANTPELVRSVRVRLGVRSREADRANDVPNGVGTGLFRFNIGTGVAGTADSYARVRTFQADIALHNQADILW